MQAFGGLDSRIALKFKIKQSKNCTVTHKFLHFPTNYSECQMIAVKKCQSTIAVACSSLFSLGLDFHGPYRQRTFMAEF